MSGATAWLVVGIVGAGTMAMKSAALCCWEAGPADRAMSVISLLAPAVLAALIARRRSAGTTTTCSTRGWRARAAAAIALRFARRCSWS
jgi:hypothetical protein